MSVAKKRLQPANDDAYAKMPCVSLPRPNWNPSKTGILVLLAGFALLFCLGVAANLQTPPVQKQLTAPPQASTAPTAPEPYDITINASELAPPPNENQLASGEEKIPTILIHPQANSRPHPLPPVLEITVDEDDAAPQPAPEQNMAARKAEAAKTFARQGNLQQALRLQHRATELAPANMLYRLDLAILYDRLGEKAGAAALYRQVVDAHETKDETLPPGLAIENIRARLDYLVAATNQNPQ